MNGILLGSGTSADPYLVEDVADFNIGLRGKVSSTTALYFKQVVDLDFGTISRTDSGGYYGYIPIYFRKHNYDGGNFKIINLYIEDDAYGYAGSAYKYIIGLFSTLDKYGSVKNLHLTDMNIVSRNKSYNPDNYIKCAGGIIGISAVNTYIDNCSVSGTIKSYKNNKYDYENVYTGGIVGISNSEITNCEFNGTVEAYGYTGGICGSGAVKQCKGQGTINVGDSPLYTNVGGLTGEGSVKKSSFLGDININMGDYSYSTCCGGLTGSGLVEKSVADVKIRGKVSWCGGLTTYGEVTESASYIDIDTISTKIGGLNTAANITNGYAIGTIKSVSGCVAKCLSVDETYYDTNWNETRNYLVAYSYSSVSINGNIVEIDNINGAYANTLDFSLFNKDLGTDTLKAQSGRTTVELRDIETYKPYSRLWSGDTNNLTNAADGDVTQTIYQEEVYYGGLKLGYLNEMFTRINGSWERIAVRSINAAEWTHTYTNDEWLGTDLGQQTGDIYTFYNQADSKYKVYVYDGTQYNLEASLDFGIATIYVYDAKYKPIKNDSTNSFTIGSTTYNVYQQTLDPMGQYDFVSTWTIDGTLNNGFPYLINVDYEGILNTKVVNYINVIARDVIKKIPLYDGEAGSNKASAKIVDITDPKASQVRVYINGVIKSWSL